MKQKRDRTETLITRALVLQVPHEIAIPLVKQFIEFLTFNGEEWTCNRYKGIKLDFIRLKAGLLPSTPWISRKNNKFSGPIGGLQSWCSTNHKRWSKAIQLLQIYSSLISSVVTPTQRDKFCLAVESKNDSSYLDFYSNLAVSSLNTIKRIPIFVGDPSPLVLRPVSDGRSEPHASGASYPEGTRTLDCVSSYITGTDEGRYLRKKYSSIFDCVLRGISFNSKFGSFVPGAMYHRGSVGKIGLIQEPGFKLRAVANPGRVYQQALEPLGNALSYFSQSLPWDCTYMQDKGFSSNSRTSKMWKSMSCSGFIQCY